MFENKQVLARSDTVVDFVWVQVAYVGNVTEVQPMRMFAIILPIIMLSVLAGCASSSTTYGPDGRSAHTINCSGLARTWGACYEKAGDLCGSAGYDVMDRDTDQGALITGNRNGFTGGVSNSRSLVVACRGYRAPSAF